MNIKYELFFVDDKERPKQTICTEEEFDKIFNPKDYE